MAGIHYVFRKNPKTGDMKLLNIAQTLSEAKAIKTEHLRRRKYLPGSVMILELVG